MKWTICLRNIEDCEQRDKDNDSNLTFVKKYYWMSSMRYGQEKFEQLHKRKRKRRGRENFYHCKEANRLNRENQENQENL